MIDELEHAGAVNRQILAMITEHSRLVKSPSMPEVFGANYCVIEEGKKVIACVKITTHNWYLAEFTHLVVLPEFRRQGYGRRVLTKALEEAESQEMRIVQCTIRQDNFASLALFADLGFQSAHSFEGISGRPVSLWQRLV